jgi:hypothetical protein
MFEVTRKRRTKITATSPRGFAAHRLGTTSAEEKRRCILHDSKKTRRLADFLSLPVNLHTSTHFSKHILFLHLQPLNFKPLFIVIKYNQLNRRVQFAAGSRVAYRSYKSLISSGVHPVTYWIGTGIFLSVDMASCNQVGCSHPSNSKIKKE